MPSPKEQVSQSPSAFHQTSSAPANSQDRIPSIRSEYASQKGPILPPVASLPGYSSVTSQTQDSSPPASARPFGMHSILNPSGEADPQRQIPRVSQSPARSVSANYGSLQTPLVSPRVRKRGQDETPGHALQGIPEQRHGRRLLTPKSPALRSLSQTVRGSPSDNRSARASIGSAEGRIYTAEPGESASSAIPPLPPLARSTQGSLFTAISAQDVGQGASAASHSNSTVSYSGTTQGLIGSPSSSSNLAEREDASPYHSGAMDANIHQLHPSARPYGPGQQSYQMQLATDQGPMIVPVEVDIQQASKLADEKRKRNAGASARFRQRRKEKEQAAATTIAELQRQIRETAQQLREKAEDAEHYMAEYNALRDLMARTPGVQVPPRALSPRRRRTPMPKQFPGIPSDSSAALDYGRHEVPEHSPAQRRRTSEYQPSFAPVQMASANYGGFSQPSTNLYALPPPALPASLPDTRSQLPPPAPPATSQQHLNQTQSSQQHQQAPPTRHLQYDPFRRDTNPR